MTDRENEERCRVGSVVFAKAGRERGKLMAVVASEGDYRYLVDGQMRLLSKPKKKKLMHIQKTNWSIDLSRLAADEGRRYSDGDIKKKLAALLKGGEDIVEE